MRFVYVCQHDPWRLDGGALIRNYWFVRGLAERYRVDLVTAGDPTQSVPADFAERCASISRCPAATNIAARASRVTGMLRPHASYYSSGVVTDAMRARVRELTRERDTVAVVDLRVLDALGASAVPVLYQAHNAEADHLARRAEIERSRALRAFIRLDAARLRTIETSLLRRARVIAACSNADREDLARLAPEARAKTIVAPNGVDLARYASVATTRGDGRTVLITGSYDWRPNVAGLDWFIERVMPLLRTSTREGELQVRVAGRMSAALAARLDATPGMAASAHPQDMCDELRRATIVAAPIRSSSGTRLRILEAWGAGRPVVTTPAGALGLEYRNGDDLIAVEDPAAFAAAIIGLMRDAADRERLREAALQRARTYAWSAIIERFLDESAALLERRRETFVCA